MVLTPEVYAVGSIAGLCAILVWRVREGRTAVTAKKLIMPPLGMATGFSMFIAPAFRVPWMWGIAAFLIGAIVFAYPLLLTSSLRRDGDVIMMKRSGAFFAVVIVLFAIRYMARGYFDRILSIEQTGAIFYLLAFGMIVRWRASLYMAYRALTTSVSSLATDRPAEETAAE
ncbi:MAG TPA: cytochrome c biogenesis protein CcdC [Terracidiphilus sp.]|nr:cytochrome c biogenesis protein CcdC [Terracidiphilus sp.]